jgi:hypothetical protein
VENVGFRLGSNYLGSSDIQLSSANQEIIPLPPAGWTGKYNFYKFSFFNEQSVKVKVNGGNPIYLQANQGFNIDQVDAPIYSFVIVDAGITFNWIGAY